MFPNINLTHLKYFHDAARLKSVSAASRENFVSQSAVSQGIMNLEKALQVRLTTHQRQNFYLTEEGEIVFKETRKIFSAVESLKGRLKELKGETAGEVHFACTNAIAQFFLASRYLKIREQYPLIEPKFHRGSLNFIHEALKQEKVSFALAIESPELQRYEKEPLSKGHFRLYKKKGIKTNLGIFVDHLESPELSKLCQNYYKSHKKELIIQEALSSWGMVASFIQNGCGIGFVPEFIFAGNKNIEEVDFDLTKIEYKICAFKLKGTALSMASKAFLNGLKT